ncbi:hypothetical protein H4Q26_011566 [Puccinia striiformis f. sp. tritici PST-130]|nr:hypothetical protein H4Q26_011566 [Puccinia striiformis f. sp. tritici PST-130]
METVARPIVTSKRTTSANASHHHPDSNRVESHSRRTNAPTRIQDHHISIGHPSAWFPPGHSELCSMGTMATTTSRVLLTTGVALPLVLAHSDLINQGACYMSMTGGALVYGTIVTYSHFFSPKDEF